MPVEFDCLTCGICCMAITGQDEYRVVLKPDDDIKSIPKNFIVEIPISRTKRYAIKLKTDDQGLRVCACLTGEIGKSVACYIHATKPLACKDFPKDGPTCKFYRNKI